MPEIKNFAFCLNTEYINGKNNIFGIFSAMTPEYIPGLFSFSVFFTILNLKTGEHQLTLLFKDSNNIITASFDNATLSYEKEETVNLPDQYMGINVAVNFQNVDIKHSGLYRMEVLLDDQQQGAFSIYVKGKNENI